jgi:magnesium-transporting ATPase (P-type)
MDDLLLIDGKVLEVIFSDASLRTEFFTIASKAESVVVCRCQPEQKAKVALYV